MLKLKQEYVYKFCFSLFMDDGEVRDVVKNLENKTHVSNTLFNMKSFTFFLVLEYKTKEKFLVIYSEKFLNYAVGNGKIFKYVLLF